MEEPGVSQRYVDPFAVDEEKDKWRRRAAFGTVVVLRVIIAGLIFVLKLFKALGVEILRTFKLLP